VSRFALLGFSGFAGAKPIIRGVLPGKLFSFSEFHEHSDSERYIQTRDFALLHIPAFLVKFCLPATDTPGLKSFEQAKHLSRRRKGGNRRHQHLGGELQ
jgi:hypothetical protein